MGASGWPLRLRLEGGGESDFNPSFNKGFRVVVTCVRRNPEWSSTAVLKLLADNIQNSLGVFTLSICTLRAVPSLLLLCDSTRCRGREVC